MKRKALPLLFLLILSGLLTGCFRDVLSWSPDGRYLSYIEPKEERLFIWDSKTDQSKPALDTTGTAMAIFLPKRWFAGQELLVGIKTPPGKEGGMADRIDLSILRMKSKETTPVASKIEFANYDIGRKGWVYYVIGQKNTKDSEPKKFSLWGYNIRKDSQRLVYESTTEMMFPSSDGDGRVLMATGADLMEINADKGTTRSLATMDKPFWYPMWADKGKSVIYLEIADQGETATLCRINLETKTTESLMTKVTPMCRVQVSKNGKWALATVVKGKEMVEAARVNLQGKPVVEYLMPKDGVALYGTLSPDGNWLAYCLGNDADNYEKVVVKDLKSGVEKVVWEEMKE